MFLVSNGMLLPIQLKFCLYIAWIRVLLASSCFIHKSGWNNPWFNFLPFVCLSVQMLVDVLCSLFMRKQMLQVWRKNWRFIFTIHAWGKCRLYECTSKWHMQFNNEMSATQKPPLVRFWTSFLTFLQSRVNEHTI